MSTPVWAASSRIKIKRAKKHVLELERALGAFREAHPYFVSREVDPETGELVFRARISSEPDPEFGGIIGDIAHNLHSALDNLIGQLYESATGRKAPKKLYFPITDTRKEFEARPHTEIQRIGQGAVDLIKQTKAYKTGNEPLWAIRKLNNRDKHHVISTAYASVRHVEIWMSGQTWMALRPRDKVPGRGRIALGVFPERQHYPVKDGAELYRLPAALAGHMDVQPKGIFDIAFGEVDGLQGKPLLPTLHNYTQVVEGVVESFARLPIPPRRSPGVHRAPPIS